MSRADFLLTPEELLHRRRKRLRLVVVLVLLVVFAVGAYFGTRPTLNAIKSWQARRHATKAFAFIEEQKWNEARDAAVAGYQLRPSEPQAVRAVARFLSRTKQQQALEFWDRLEKTERLTRDDRRDEAAVALAMGEGTRAAEAIAHLLDPAMGEPGPADWLLAAQAAVQGGQAEEAVPYLEKILAAPSANEREQLQAALLRLALPAPERDPAQAARTAALARVVELSRSDSAVGLDALLILAQHAASLTTAREQAPADAGQPNDSAAEATAESSPASAALPGTDAIPSLPDLATAIERHPLAQPPHQLLALDLKAHQQVGGREASIEQAIARWKDAEAPAVAALATWLNGKGEHERLLAVVPLDRALQTHDLFLQYVDALGAIGRWSEIKALLDTERFPLDPVIQRMYLARINAQLGEKTASENNWQRSLEAAGGDVGKLMTLADYAEKNGAVETAATAYERAAATAPRLRPAQQGRLRAAQRTADTRRIHAVLADMLDLWPNDPAVQNDEAYMRLLLMPGLGEVRDQRPEASGQFEEAAGQQPPPNHQEPLRADRELNAIEQLASGLVAAAPASLPHRTLLALARLKQGHAAGALEVYADLSVPPSALTASALAVHAAVLAANGHTDDAQSEASQLNPEQLLPEERALIEPLRTATDGPPL